MSHPQPILLSVGLVLGTCTRPPIEATVPTRIIVVLVDTLRADHLGVYGYPRATSPILDAWAADATVFTHARAPSPWTLPSARALLSADRIRDFDPTDTVATRLQNAGWRTVLLSANPNISAPRGFHAGWHEASLHEAAPAAEQVGRAVDALRASVGPTFVLVHLMDPHLPYAEPDALRHVFAGQPPTERLHDPISEPRLRASLAEQPLAPAERSYIVDRYDQNVRAVDGALAELWPELSPTDLVVVLSDHGEALGEHGQVGHGHGLGTELVHVPLLWKGPGFSPGARSDWVSLDDVGATLLAAAGLPLEPQLRGRDLRKTELPHRDVLLSHLHYGPAQVGLARPGGSWATDGQTAAPTDAPGGLEGASARPLGSTEEADWAGAGGAEWTSAVRVRLKALTAFEARNAEPGLSAVRLRIPGSTGQPYWPPDPLLARTPTRIQLGDGTWELGLDGPFALPAELYVPVPRSRRRVDDVVVTVRTQGQWSDPIPAGDSVVRVPPALP